ncbi:MAG: TatD family hydrolase [Microbacteriaceae bacterium]
MTILDMHCHLDLYPQRDDTISAGRSEGVDVLVATNRASEYRNVRAVLADDITVGIGIHPEAAGSTYLRHELSLFQDLVDTTPLISEIGLDEQLANRPSQYFGDSPTMKAQQALFERILESDLHGRVISVHSRGAERLVADLLAQAKLTAVFHWFHGSREDAEYVAGLGNSFSVNAAMLQVDKRTDLLAWIPDDLLLLETDGPFVGWDGGIMQPAELPELLDALARIRERNSEDLRDVVEANSSRILGRLSTYQPKQ